MAGKELLRLRQVEYKTGLKKSHLYNLVQSGNFPLPVRLSTRAVAWISDEIDSWIESLPRVSRFGAGNSEELSGR